MAILNKLRSVYKRTSPVMRLCAPSTSASVIIIIFRILMNFRSCVHLFTQPIACIKSLSSWFARSFSADALATLSIFPLSGSIAWVFRSRACLVNPPAESPSTIKSSVPPDPKTAVRQFPWRRNLRVADFRLTSFYGVYVVFPLPSL